MNIFGVNQNIGQVTNDKGANKQPAGTAGYDGPKFIEVARSVNISIAGQSSASSLNLSRQKEKFDTLFNPDDEEKEELLEHLSVIKKLMEQFKK